MDRIQTNGVVTLEVYFEYQGDQDEDRVWHGNAFYVDAQIQLIFREGWDFVEDEPLIIIGCKTDKDLDHEAEQDYEYEQYQKAQKKRNDSPDEPFEV